VIKTGAATAPPQGSQGGHGGRRSRPGTPPQGRNGRVLHGHANSTLIEQLHEVLGKQEWVQSVESITSTAVPVVRASATSSQTAGSLPVTLDISFAAPNHRGPLAVLVVREMIESQGALRPLVLQFKGLLKQFDLCNAYTGGLSSYATVLLVAYFLGKQRKRLYAFDMSRDLGYLYVSLLDFIARLDPAKEIIYITSKFRCLDRENDSSSQKPGGDATDRSPPTRTNNSYENGFPELHIVDPTAEDNNVGRTAFRFYEVQQACKHTVRGIESGRL